MRRPSSPCRLGSRQRPYRAAIERAPDHLVSELLTNTYLSLYCNFPMRAACPRRVCHFSFNATLELAEPLRSTRGMRRVRVHLVRSIFVLPRVHSSESPTQYQYFLCGDASLTVDLDY